MERGNGETIARSSEEIKVLTKKKLKRIDENLLILWNGWCKVNVWVTRCTYYHKIGSAREGRRGNPARLVCMRMCTCVCGCVFAYVCMYLLVMYVWISKCWYVSLCLGICLSVCFFVCMSVSVCMFLCVPLLIPNMTKSKLNLWFDRRSWRQNFCCVRKLYVRGECRCLKTCIRYTVRCIYVKTQHRSI